MSESVNLPALGESVTEGTVTRWLKNVGDRVEVDEPLVEVSTDKVDTEIPSPVAGIIEEILVAEDETVEVGAPLVRIGSGEAAPAAEPEAPAADAAPSEAAPAEAAPAEAAPAEAASAASAEAQPAEAAPAEVATAEAPAQPSTEAATEAPAPSTPEPAATEAPATEAASPVTAQIQPSTEVPAAAEAPAATAAPAATEAPAASAAPVTTGAHAAPQPPAQAPDATPAPEAPAAPTEAPAVDAADATSSANAGYVTPLVRKLANDRGVDLGSLTGSGVGGRIRKQDVLEAGDAASTETTDSSVAPSATEAAPVEVSPLRGTTVAMSRLRKVIAERAVISMQSSAQLTSVVEVDVSLVASFRNKVKDDFHAKTGNKLSFLPFFALAAAEALQAFPIINATIDGDSIVYPAHENISIAVDTERGLLTPVIRDAGSLDLAGFAAQIADLAERTRDNKLKPDELAGGTFTLTNTGSRGALFDTPIVFLPQSAILGTGIVTKKPVVVSDAAGDAIAIRSMVYLALSYDHRIVDGADAARFLVAIKDRLEGGDFAAKLGA
ncbi:MAG: 2-oxoglutarate dehydrogenase, E2 component, dihydrolipoamide succinyltransferase [Microbacteriaceae bacterium]